MADTCRIPEMRRAKRPTCPDMDSDSRYLILKQSNLDNYFLPLKESVSPPKNPFNSLYTETAEETFPGFNKKDTEINSLNLAIFINSNGSSLS